MGRRASASRMFWCGEVRSMHRPFRARSTASPNLGFQSLALLAQIGSGLSGPEARRKIARGKRSEPLVRNQGKRSPGRGERNQLPKKPFIKFNRVLLKNLTVLFLKRFPPVVLLLFPNIFLNRKQFFRPCRGSILVDLIPGVRLSRGSLRSPLAIVLCACGAFIPIDRYGNAYHSMQIRALKAPGRAAQAAGRAASEGLGQGRSSASPEWAAQTLGFNAGRPD